MTRASRLSVLNDHTRELEQVTKQVKTASEACDRECGAILHMTDGFHRTDCAAYETTTTLISRQHDLLRVIANLRRKIMR